MPGAITLTGGSNARENERTTYSPWDSHVNMVVMLFLVVLVFKSESMGTI
jgi:hypothetical protein